MTRAVANRSYQSTASTGIFEYMIINWILDNKEWLLSGIAITIPLAIIGWWYQKRSNKQVIKGVQNSVIVQVGNDIKMDK